MENAHRIQEGAYVVVRCHDAGVHAGKLLHYAGRECTLADARRLWRWIPADGSAFLSGVAVYGLATEDARLRVGATVKKMVLTEDCEILECSDEAARSISESPAWSP